jgi:hypothetical protein
VKPSERQFHLRLDARRPDDATSCRAGQQVVEECSLADAGLTPQDDRPAGPIPGARQQAVQSGAFLASVLEAMFGSDGGRHHANRIPNLIALEG